MDIKNIYMAIVEDSEEDLNNCINLLKRYGEENGVNFDISSYNTGDAFLMHYKGQFGFIILDINLASLNGIDVAKRIREKDEDVIIMFATNLAKYVTKGYEVSAIDYALKPLNYSSFYLKLDRVMKKINAKKDVFITLQLSGGFSKINIEDILYIEVIAHNVVFHLINDEISTHGSLKVYEERLASLWFIRCNSCYLVNARKIKKIDKYDIILSNGEKILISHPKRKEFINQFKQYILKEGR